MNIKIFERATESEIQNFLDEKIVVDGAEPETSRPKNIHQILQSECAISSDDGATFFSNLTITIFWD